MDPNSLNFLPGQVFGHYRVVAELARGGQGLVLRAQHAQGAMVALKVLLRAEGPAFRRFQREVDVLARLNHPNLPRILDTGMIQGHPFVAMQLVEGGSLAQRLKHRGPLPIEEAVEILDEIAKVLEYCHSLGVYHRDLKPGNVVVDQASGRPFLVDFGILKHDTSDGALSLDGASRLSLSGEVVGTISYMAPEQGGDSDVPVSPATDVYGLAATLFDLWTGRPPFKGETAYNTLLAVISQPAPDPRTLRAEVPPRAAAACLRGLAKLPQERPATPRLFLEDVKAALRAPASPPSEESPTRTPLLALGLVAAVLLFAALGLYLPVPGGLPASQPSDAPAASHPQASLSPGLASASATLTPSRPPQGSPTPRLARLPTGPPGSLTLRLESPTAVRPVVRCGPFLLLRVVDRAYGLKVRDSTPGPLELPSKAWPFGWDAEAGCLVFERRGQSFRVAPDGQEAPSPYPTGFGIVELGPLRVAAFADGRLVAFDPATPSPPAWTVLAERNRSLPLPLDLDRDGEPDHLLVCTRAGRALLIDARGKTRSDVALPSGVDQPPALLEPGPGGPTVLVACSGGVLLRYQVLPQELVELSRVDLIEPLRGPAFPVLVRGEVAAIAVVVQRAALSVLDPEVQRVEWCGRRSVPGEVVLSGPAIVDLDRDGIPELALARFTPGRGSQAWVEVYRLNGDWVTRLPAGARDLRMAPGPASLLFAAGEKGAWAWGPWDALPVPQDPPLDSERVASNLFGGAWKKVQEDCARFGGVAGKVYSALVARHLGQPDLRREISKEDMAASMNPIGQLYQDAVSDWVIHRLFAPPGHPRPAYSDQQPIRPLLQPAQGGRVGVEFGAEGIVARGIGELALAGYEPKRRLFGTGSWIRFDWPELEPGRRDLVLDQDVFRFQETGYSEITVRLDEQHVQTLSCYFGEPGELRVPLGELSSGHHRLELEFRRTTVLTRISEVRIEPAR